MISNSLKRSRCTSVSCACFARVHSTNHCVLYYAFFYFNLIINFLRHHRLHQSPSEIKTGGFNQQRLFHSHSNTLSTRPFAKHSGAVTISTYSTTTFARHDTTQQSDHKIIESVQKRRVGKKPKIRQEKENNSL